MESICRLCCSTNYVNNFIFDEENALNLKMELFLPIKVMKGDPLPQKVCNRCSCKVNDIYQFCNIAIEAQDRLRSMLLRVGSNFNDSIDLTLTKRETDLPEMAETLKIEQGTQTEKTDETDEVNLEKLKAEPKSRTPSPIKRECSIESDRCEPSNIPSDSSEDVSLISLKKRKRGRKANTTNGEAPVKRGRKKKAKLKDWEVLMNALPDCTAISIVRKPEDSVKREVIETDFDDVKQKLKTTVEVKKEPVDGDTHQCCICFTQCYSRIDMLQHYRQHAVGEKGAPPPAPPAPDPPRCSRCRKVVEGGTVEWGLHWARHWERDTRPYRCALCERAFRDPHQILKHGQTHKVGESAQAQPLNKRFICDLCPEGFVYMRYLLAHRSRAHPEAMSRPLSLRCAVCARSFAHLNSLRRHLRAHSGERNHLCSVCGKALSSREHLKFHLRIHSGYKPNVCNLRCAVCARSFAHLNSLRRHLRAHSGERNHLCSVCGKALSSREHLKFHLRIHSGYKPNVCKTCGKGFVKKCNLTLHERVHSGEKPHVCSHCGKAFSQRSTLVIHERYHSGARPYACALCGRGFVAKGLLSMHLKTTCI